MSRGGGRWKKGGSAIDTEETFPHQVSRPSRPNDWDSQLSRNKDRKSPDGEKGRQGRRGQVRQLSSQIAGNLSAVTQFQAEAGGRWNLARGP